MPFIIFTFAGFAFAFTGSPKWGISIIISCIIWMAFFLMETVINYSKRNIIFDLRSIPWFIVLSAVLDILGIVFILIGIFK